MTKIKDSKTTLADLLRCILEQDQADTYVRDVSSFLRNYSTVVTMNHETGKWDSTFGKNAEAVIAVTFHTNCKVAIDTKQSSVEVSDPSRSTETHHFNRSNSESVFGLKIESKMDVADTYTLLLTYDGEVAEITWDMGLAASYDATLIGAGFEKSQSISGSFSLVYVVNYLDLSRFHVYSSSKDHNGLRASTDSEMHFALQFMSFLEYIETSRTRKDEYLISAEKKFRFKTDLSSTLYLLKAEKDKMSSIDVSTPVDSLIHRIF